MRQARNAPCPARGCNRGLIAVTAAATLVLANCWAAYAQIKTKSDGSRTPAVHLIPLFTEKDVQIKPGVGKEEPEPFSTRVTCGKGCHDYKVISGGWHFNAVEATAPPGRSGEPYVLVDRQTGTQLPLSYRDWPGTYRPKDVGLSAYAFTQRFGRQMPGGGPEEKTEGDAGGEDRWELSGPLEIDCQGCHSPEGTQNQSLWAVNINQQNFRWASTAAGGLGLVKGDISSLPFNYVPGMPTDPDKPEQEFPSVRYDKTRFDPENKVFFDSVNRPPAQRCYFCHSTHAVSKGSPEVWEKDLDVHLLAGLTCTDCHRNGINHDMTRGYDLQPELKNLRKDLADAQADKKQADIQKTSLEAQLNEIKDRDKESAKKSEDDLKMAAEKAKRLARRVSNLAEQVKRVEAQVKPAATLTCRGCHMGESKEASDLAGRLGAPCPVHKGLPTVHLEKLSCTACHSGPWPEKEARRVQTSRAHGLGIHGKHNGDPVLPYVASPVFLRDETGKLAPHNAIFPAFWARLKGQAVSPMALSEALKAGQGILSIKPKGPPSEKYDPLTADQIAKTLANLAAEKSDAGEPVYVCGGMMYRLGSDGKLAPSEHPAAAPYCWPIAHDVRPAGKSLGVRGCDDCHSTDSPIFFALVAAESPAQVGEANVKAMYELQGADGTYWRMFAGSFVFRPMLKTVGLVSSALMAAVLILYGFLGLQAVLKRVGGNTEKG